MQKSPTDIAAIKGLATAALLEYIPDYDSPSCGKGQEMPTADIASEALDIELPGQMVSDANAQIIKTFKRAFYFGLHLGARLGADPLHIPQIDDLVKRYRFTEAVRAAKEVS